MLIRLIKLYRNGGYTKRGSNIRLEFDDIIEYNVLKIINDKSLILEVFNRIKNSHNKYHSYLNDIQELYSISTDNNLRIFIDQYLTISDPLWTEHKHKIVFNNFDMVDNTIIPQIVEIVYNDTENFRLYKINHMFDD